MLIQTKPNSWSCIATAFAIVLEMPVSEFFEKLGHDGSQKVADLPDPGGRRGIHAQECIFVAQQLGRAVTPVELFPVIRVHNQSEIPVLYHDNVMLNWERFENLISTTKGVVTGRGPVYGHAMAYDRGQLFDPDCGGNAAYSRQHCAQQGFYTQCLWIVT
jgi:hypothetical protein